MVKKNSVNLLNWSNTDNANLYENIPLDEFYKIAAIGGLDSGRDIEAIIPYIQSSKSILEIGAGYGRVLNHIITRNYNAKLSAIERSRKLCAWLKSQYQHRVTIFNNSLCSFEPTEKYDLILWMWAGLAEFSKKEQLSALSKLSLFLSQRGKIIIDMIPLDKKALNAIELTKQEQIIETKYGSDHCYVPSETEILSYTKEIGLNLIEKIIYESLPQRLRSLYVIGF